LHFAPPLVFHFSFFCTPLLFFPYSVNQLPVLDALSCTPHPYSRTLLVIFFTTLILLCSTSPFPVLPFYFFIFSPSCTYFIHSCISPLLVMRSRTQILGVYNTVLSSKTVEETFDFR
jgi:hypothetical protein